MWLVSKEDFNLAAPLPTHGSELVFCDGEGGERCSVPPSPPSPEFTPASPKLPLSEPSCPPHIPMPFSLTDTLSDSRAPSIIVASSSVRRRRDRRRRLLTGCDSLASVSAVWSVSVSSSRLYGLLSGSFKTVLGEAQHQPASHTEGGFLLHGARTVPDAQAHPPAPVLAYFMPFLPPPPVSVSLGPSLLLL